MDIFEVHYHDLDTKWLIDISAASIQTHTHVHINAVPELSFGVCLHFCVKNLEKFLVELPKIEGNEDQFQLPTWMDLESLWKQVSGMAMMDFLDQVKGDIQTPKCVLHHSVGWDPVLNKNNKSELSTMVHLSLLSD